MALLKGRERSVYVRRMFSHLAGRYDRANRWMTWGQDVKWRREVVERAELSPGSRLLDVGTGTGGLAMEAVGRLDNLWVVGADFSPQMLQVGRQREGAGLIQWVENDALDLPYESGSFDAVVSGYLLRNVSDVDRVLRELHRVLKPGGRLVCLDTTPPPGDLWHLPVRWYLQYVIPLVGGWAAGDRETYRYLPGSTAAFQDAPQLADSLFKAGFRQVGFRRFMGGSMAIHWGIKQALPG